MSIHSLFEKLQLRDERNLLIQGIPSSIEKQFAKIAYSKSVTPLLRSKKIDFALVFAINQSQLNNILQEVFSALTKNSKLWVACPKTSSKIVSDLNRDSAWKILIENGYEGITQVTLDHVWRATRFAKTEQLIVSTADDNIIEENDFEKELNATPRELETVLLKHKKAKEIYSTLPVSHKREYVSWIQEAKRADTRQRRAEATLEKLLSSKAHLAIK